MGTEGGEQDPEGGDPPPLHSSLNQHFLTPCWGHRAESDMADLRGHAAEAWLES